MPINPAFRIDYDIIFPFLHWKFYFGKIILDLFLRKIDQQQKMQKQMWCGTYYLEKKPKWNVD